MDDDARIVCGIDVNGSPAAVALAAREAERTGCALHLVHVRSPLSVDLEERALERAREAALAVAPRLVVTIELVEDDWVAAALARTAEGAHCLVIERTGRGRLERVLSGSTANGSAVLCTAPLLSVPHDWSPESAAARPPVVTVAVQDVAEARDLVPVAAREAGARGCELVVLHAVDHGDAADVADVAGLLEPTGPVRVEVSHEAASDALVTASAASRLLVLGRRQRDRPWGTHVGPVVRRTLLDATCPVLLAAESDASSVSTGARDSLVTPVRPSPGRPPTPSRSCRAT